MAEFPNITPLMQRIKRHAQRRVDLARDLDGLAAELDKAIVDEYRRVQGDIPVVTGRLKRAVTDDESSARKVRVTEGATPSVDIIIDHPGPWFHDNLLPPIPLDRAVHNAVEAHKDNHRRQGDT